MARVSCLCLLLFLSRFFIWLNLIIFVPLCFIFESGGLAFPPRGGWRFAWCGYRGQRSKYRVLKRTEKGSAISRNTVDCERKENKLILWPDLTRFVHKMCWKSEKALNTSQCRLQQLTGNKKFCSSTLLFNHKSPWTFVVFFFYITYQKRPHIPPFSPHILLLSLFRIISVKKN